MWLGTDSKCSVPKPVEEVVRDYTVLRYVMDISFISHMHTLSHIRDLRCLVLGNGWPSKSGAIQGLVGAKESSINCIYQCYCYGEVHVHVDRGETGVCGLCEGRWRESQWVL